MISFDIFTQTKTVILILVSDDDSVQQPRDDLIDDDDDESRMSKVYVSKDDLFREAIKKDTSVRSPTPSQSMCRNELASL